MFSIFLTKFIRLYSPNEYTLVISRISCFFFLLFLFFLSFDPDRNVPDNFLIRSNFGTVEIFLFFRFIFSVFASTVEKLYSVINSWISYDDVRYE